MLRLLLLLPVLGALVVALLPRGRGEWMRRTALGAALATLLAAWSLLLTFQPGAEDIQFFESHAWNPRLGSALSLGLDGFSFPMVLLVTLLIFVALLAFRVPRASAKLYYLLLLLLESAVLGVFMARDWSLFYVFWELTLIPLFFLIERLGGQGRQRAALNFVLYTMGGSVFMLVALLLLYDASAGHSFDMAKMAAAGQGLTVERQTLIFLGLFIGFAVKMGLFPLHGWLPAVYAEAPGAVPLVSSGILLKMGAYGILRAVETLPDAAAALQDKLALLAGFTLLYGAVLAWRQRELIAMASYASISHMAVVLLGILTLGSVGLTGAGVQMLGHGLSAGLLFLLVGIIAERQRGTGPEHYAGLMRRMPRLATLLVLALIGSIGLPATIGFVAELHVIAAGIGRWGAAMALLPLAALIGAAWGLRVAGRVIHGQPSPFASSADLTRPESVAAALLLAGTFVLGLFPWPVLVLVGSAATHLARSVGVTP